MVDDFMLALQDNSITGLALSPSALATLALYHHILVVSTKKPADACRADVEPVANSVPAY